MDFGQIPQIILDYRPTSGKFEEFDHIWPFSTDGLFCCKILRRIQIFLSQVHKLVTRGDIKDNSFRLLRTITGLTL